MAVLALTPPLRLRGEGARSRRTRSESLSNAVKSNMSQSSIHAGLGGRADWAGPWGVAARGVARRANMAGANQLMKL
jgi:hypothetical protein